MTSTNDGKDVKSNQTSGPKGKTYYIELYKSLEAGLSSDCELRERTQHLCEAWRRIHSLCQHSAPSTHPHLLSWLQRHTARIVLQTEWQSPKSKEEHKTLEEAINAFIKECENRSGGSRDAGPPPWETQLVARGEWFKKILGNPWGHPVLRVLLDPRGEPPSDEEVLEWLKEERGVMFVTRLRQLTASKCDDLALSLSSAVMERVRASAVTPTDAETEQTTDVKDKPKAEKKPTFEDILKNEAGFTVDVWELLIDMEFVLLHKGDKRSRCIELAKQTPLRNGYQLVERLQSRLETSPREKKLWKNAKEVATLIAQVVITRCMVVPVCSGAPRTALYCCARSLVRALGPRLPPAARALAAPAATARHLHTLAAAVDAQSKEAMQHVGMKPFVCELYVRAITAGMNELERLKLKTEKEADARKAEQILASWFTQLGALLSASERIRCECTLTAFSVHPTPALYDRIQAAPALPPLIRDDHEVKEEPNKEFGSWASDSRGQTNFVKTSETLNLKHTQHQANVLSTAIFSEGEVLGISPELCTDIAVLLSGPRLKTLSWDTDRELLLQNCRTYMERTHCGTRALTTELKYLNLDPREFLHLPEEEDDDTDIYYGIEKGYEHLVEEYQEPEEIWQDAEDLERTQSAHSDIESETLVKTKKAPRKTKKIPSSEEDSDPLSLVAEAKRVEKKKERPLSKERRKDSKEKSKEPKKSKSKAKPKDPLEIKDQSTEKKKEPKKKRERKKKEKLVPSTTKCNLSSLVGMKVVNTIKKPDLPGVNTPYVSDSDHDCQGKSSNSILSENNETNVLFDGLFSMDELKSPEKSPDKNTLTKNSEFQIVSGTVGVSTSVVHHNQSPSRTESPKHKLPSSPQPRTGLPTNMTVKESLSKLLHYRRQKAIENEQRINLQPNVVHTYSYKQGAETPTITPASSPVSVTPEASPKAQLTVNVPENPKVYINKTQSEQLSELRNEVNNLLSTKTFGIARPVIQYGPKTNNCLLNNTQTSGVRVPNPNSQKPMQDMYKIPQTQVKETTVGSTESKATPSRSNVPTKSVDSPSQQNFHIFLKELQESINAGAHSSKNVNIKKEIKPISRVTPVVPKIKAEPNTSQCAKQSQKKTSDFLNTFSRLSYLHKNKVDPRGNGTKPVVDALIEYQSKTLQNPPTDAEINRILMEQKLAAKCLQMKNESATTKSDRAAHQRPENSQSLLKKFDKPKHVSNTAKQNPIMANMLAGQIAKPVKPENQNKNIHVQRPRDMSTPSNKYTSLTERDTQDLLALLRQQTKLNHRPKVEHVKEKVQPPQTITGHMPSTNYSVPCTSQSSNKLKILEPPNITYNNVNIKQVTKPSPTIKPSNINLDLRMPQIKPLNMVKTELNCTKTVDPKPVKKIEILSNIEIKSSMKHKSETVAKPKEDTDWEKVMDAILSHKTPSRGPKALDMALNKDAYNKALAESLRNQRIVKANSTGDLLKMTNVISKGQAKSALTAEPTPTPSPHPPVLSRSNTESVIKTTKKSSKTPAKLVQKPLSNTSVLQANPNVTRPETPKRQIETEKRSSHGTKDQIDVLKKLPVKHQEKQFTAPYYKEEDPFISGIPNSDYDLLEELMDDDLRQEIGELSSDEDNYTAPMQSLKGKNYSINKPITPAIQEERLNPTMLNTASSHKKLVLKVKSDIPKTAFDSSVQKQHTSAFVNVKSVIKTTEFINNEAKNVQPTIAVHQMPQTVVIPSKNLRNQSCTNTDQLRTVDQTNTFVATMPRQTALKNVVLIGSDIVYQPCAVQTPVLAANVIQNTYVTYTNQQNMALYQTTQFAAPVVNPVIIGNAMTVSKTTTPMTEPLTTVANKPEIVVQTPKSKEEIRNDVVQNKTVIHDTKYAKSEPKTNPVDNPNDDAPKSEKEKVDINSNKNVCERKVLSEVQEKQQLEKIEPKITRSQTRKSFERDLMNEVIKDQERLQKKRLSIINRNISHRIDKKAIPLSYSPLKSIKIIIRVPKAAQEKYEKVKSASDTKNDSKIQSGTVESIKAKTTEEPAEAKLIAKVDKPDKTINTENYKENKDKPSCRRILLRSSNKDVKLDTEVAEKVSVPRKTKVRLKPTPSVSENKTLENCTDGDSINKLKVVKKPVTKKTLNKTIKKVETKKKVTKIQPKRNAKGIKITINRKLESKPQELISNEMTDLMDIEDEIITSKILQVLPNQPVPPLQEIPNVEEILGDIGENRTLGDSIENCPSPSILENDSTVNQLLQTESVDKPIIDSTVITQENANNKNELVNKEGDTTPEITEPVIKDTNKNTTDEKNMTNTDVLKEIESYVKKLEDKIKDTAVNQRLELECNEIMFSSKDAIESSPSQPDRQTSGAIASVNSVKQNTTDPKISNDKAKNQEKSHIEEEVICIDEDDEEPNYIMPQSKILIKGGKINSQEKRKNGLKDDIPQSYMDAIIIEDLPHLNRGNPLKKCVRIQLPCGKVFKATVHGQMNMDTNSLFSDPALKAVLLSNVSKRKRYTLNIKQMSTTLKLKPDQVLESHIHEIRLKTNETPAIVTETINLLSDSDEDTEQQSFNTEFGKYQVQTMKKNLLENHQKLFDKKCVVKLKREDLRNYFEDEAEIETYLMEERLPAVSFQTEKTTKNTEEPEVVQAIPEPVVEPVTQDAEAVIQPEVQHIIQSDEQPIMQSDEQPIIQSDAQPMIHPDVQPVIQSAVQSITQSDEAPITQSEDQPKIQRDVQPVMQSDEHIIQTDVQPIAKSEVQPTIQADVQTDVQPIIQADVQTDVQPINQPDQQPVIEPVIQSDVQPIIESDDQPLIPTDVQPITELDVQPMIQPDVQNDDQSDVQPTNQPDGQPTDDQPAIVPIIQSELKPEVQTKVQSDKQSVIQPVILSDDVYQPGVQPVVNPDEQPINEPMIEPDVQPVIESDVTPVVHSDSQRDVQPVIQSDEHIIQSDVEPKILPDLEPAVEQVVTIAQPDVQQIVQAIDQELASELPLIKPTQQEPVEIIEIDDSSNDNADVIDGNSDEENTIVGLLPFLELDDPRTLKDKTAELFKPAQKNSLIPVEAKINEFKHLLFKDLGIEDLAENSTQSDDLFLSYAGAPLVTDSGNSISNDFSPQIPKLPDCLVKLTRCDELVKKYENLKLLKKCFIKLVRCDVLVRSYYEKANEQDAEQSDDIIGIDIQDNTFEETAMDIVPLSRSGSFSILDNCYLFDTQTIDQIDRSNSPVMEAYETIASLCNRKAKVTVEKDATSEISTCETEWLLTKPKIHLQHKNSSIQDHRSIERCNTASISDSLILNENNVLPLKALVLKLFHNHSILDQINSRLKSKLNIKRLTPNRKRKSLETIVTDSKIAKTCDNSSQTSSKDANKHFETGRINLMTTDLDNTWKDSEIEYDKTIEASSFENSIIEVDSRTSCLDGSEDNISASILQNEDLMQTEFYINNERPQFQIDGVPEATELDTENVDEDSIPEIENMSQVAGEINVATDTELVSEVGKLDAEETSKEGSESVCINTDVTCELTKATENIDINVETSPEIVNITEDLLTNEVTPLGTESMNEKDGENVRNNDNAILTETEVALEKRFHGAGTQIAATEMVIEEICGDTETELKEMETTLMNTCGEAETKQDEAGIVMEDICDHADKKLAEPQMTTENVYEDAGLKLVEDPAIFTDNVSGDTNSKLTESEMITEISVVTDAILVDTGIETEAGTKPDDPEIIMENNICNNADTTMAEPEMVRENICEEARSKQVDTEMESDKKLEEPEIVMDDICGDANTKLDPETASENICKDTDAMLVNTGIEKEADTEHDDPEMIIKDICDNADTSIAEPVIATERICENTDAIFVDTVIEKEAVIKLDEPEIVMEGICGATDSKFTEPVMPMRNVCVEADTEIETTEIEKEADSNLEKPEIVVEDICGDADIKLVESEMPTENVCEDSDINMDMTEIVNKADTNLEGPGIVKDIHNNADTMAEPERATEKICEHTDAILVDTEIENESDAKSNKPEMVMEGICVDVDTKLAESKMPSKNVCEDTDTELETTEIETDTNLEEPEMVMEGVCSDADIKLAEPEMLTENIYEDIDTEKETTEIETDSCLEMTIENIFADTNTVLPDTEVENEANAKPNEQEMVMEGICGDADTKFAESEMPTENVWEDTELERTGIEVDTNLEEPEIIIIGISDDTDTRLAESEMTTENISEDADTEFETTEIETDTNLEEPEMATENICEDTDAVLVNTEIEKEANAKPDDPEMVMEGICDNIDSKMTEPEMPKENVCEDADAAIETTETEKEVDTNLEEPEIDKDICNNADTMAEPELTTENICKVTDPIIANTEIEKEAKSTLDEPEIFEEYICNNAGTTMAEPEIATENICDDIDAILVDTETEKETVITLDEPEVVMEDAKLAGSEIPMENNEDVNTNMKITEIINEAEADSSLEGPEIVMEVICQYADEELVLPVIGKKVDKKIEEPETAMVDFFNNDDTKMATEDICDGADAKRIETEIEKESDTSLEEPEIVVEVICQYAEEKLVLPIIDAVTKLKEPEAFMEKLQGPEMSLHKISESTNTKQVETEIEEIVIEDISNNDTLLQQPEITLKNNSENADIKEVPELEKDETYQEKPEVVVENICKNVDTKLEEADLEKETDSKLGEPKMVIQGICNNADTQWSEAEMATESIFEVADEKRIETEIEKVHTNNYNDLDKKFKEIESTLKIMFEDTDSMLEETEMTIENASKEPDTKRDKTDVLENICEEAKTGIDVEITCEELSGNMIEKSDKNLAKSDLVRGCLEQSTIIDNGTKNNNMVIDFDVEVICEEVDETIDNEDKILEVIQSETEDTTVAETSVITVDENDVILNRSNENEIVLNNVNKDHNPQEIVLECKDETRFYVNEIDDNYLVEEVVEMHSDEILDDEVTQAVLASAVSQVNEVSNHDPVSHIDNEASNKELREQETLEFVLVPNQDTNLKSLENNVLCGEHSDSLMDCEDEKSPEQNILLITQQLGEDGQIEEIDIKLNIPRITYSKKYPHGFIFNCLFSNMKNRKRKIDMTDVKINEKRYRKGKHIDSPKINVTTIGESGYGKEFKQLLDYCSSVKFSYSRPFHKEYIDVQQILQSWPIKGNCNVEQSETGTDKDETLFTDMEIEENTIHHPSLQTLAEEIDSNYNESNYKSCDVIETNFNMGFGEGSGRVIQNLEDGCGTKFSAATLSDVKQTQPLLLSENYGKCERVHNTINFTNKHEIEKLHSNIKCIQMKDKIRSFFKKNMTELSNDWIKQQDKDDSNGLFNLSDFPYGLTEPDFIQPPPFETIVQVVQVGQLPVSAAAQNPVTCDPRVTQVSNVSPSQCSAENSPGDDQSVIKTEYTELTTADLSMPLAQEYVQHIQSMPLPPHGREAMNYPMGSNYTVDVDIKPEIKIEMEETPEIKEEINDNYENSEYPPLYEKNLMNSVDYSHITPLEPNSNVTMMYNYTDKQSVPEAYPHLKQQEHLQMQQQLHQQQQQQQQQENYQQQQQQEQYQQQQKLIQQQLEQEQQQQQQQEFQQRQIELQQLQLEQEQQQQKLQEMQQQQLKQQQEEQKQQLRLQELKQQQEQQEEMQKHQQHLLELKRAQDLKQQQLQQQQELKQQKQQELKQQQQKQKELKQQQQLELKQQKQLELKQKQQKQQELKQQQQKQQELKQQQLAQLKQEKQQQQDLKQQQLKQQKQQQLQQKQQIKQQQELQQKQQMQQQQELQQKQQMQQQQELQQKQQMQQQQELQQKQQIQQQQELQQKQQMQQQELQHKQQMQQQQQQQELQQKQQIQQQQQHQEQQQLLQQQQQNGSHDKSDQIAHAMNAAGISSAADALSSNRAQALVNMISQKLRQGGVTTGQSSNNFQKTTSINAMALQQALAQILPPPLNQTNASESNQQTSNTHTPQVLHIVQGKTSSGNHPQITLVDNTQQSVINAPNSTPVLHIVQNKTVPSGPTSNGTPTQQTNSFSGLSLVDGGLQQGNQLLHIVNAGHQKNANTGQLLKRVNLLTNLTNAQGGNEQKMVQFVCKSADGKAIQLNGPHQRSMVLRLQPVETPNLQPTQPKQIDSQDLSPTHNAANNKDAEIKSRSIYEENYAKFIQNSSPKTPGPEKGTSLPKFNQAFGKQVYQDGGQKNEISNGNALSPNDDNPDCQANDNAMSLEHISQIGSPPLLLRKPATSQAQPNLVQQLKQTISPMNLHGGVIYTRQIPVNLAGGQTINLITVPSSDLVDDSNQKQQSEIEPSIIKIVPQNQTHSNSDGTEENNTHMGTANDNAHTPQPQPVLTQMRIKLPMLSKAPQMVSGGRVVRPSFFQIQRNVISGTNQPVYQQLVLTAAPQLGQQTIRLPQAQTSQTTTTTTTSRPAAVKATPSESQSSTESMSSSTLEQLREFDLVLEQVKERSTVQPKSKSKKKKEKAADAAASASTSAASAEPSRSTPAPHKQHQVLYSIGNTQPLNVAYVNRKAATPAPASTPTPTTSTFVRSPDSSGVVDSSPSSSSQIPHTVTSEPSTSSDAPAQSKSKSSSKSKSRPKASSNPPNTLKLNTAPPKPSTQKPAEDEQTTQRILYILAEYKEQVENSPDKDKPAPRRRTNPPSNPGSSKRKKSHRRNRDLSPTDDSCRTMGSEDSSCGTSQGDCNESCIDSHSPQDSPRKVVRKLTFEHETSAQSAPPTPQPRPQPQQRNVIVADGQTITVARGTAGKPSTAVLMPANYILPVSMIKGGQQIAIVTNRGPKLLTVGGGEGGATNALLLQRLIGPAGLKPVLTRPGVRHVRLPTAALHNLQAFNLATATTIQPPDSTASPAPAPTPPELIETRANSSPWRTEGREEMKPERGSSPEGEPWHLPATANPHDYSYEEVVRTDNMDRTVLDPIPDRYSPDMEAQRIFDKMFDVDSKRSYMVGSHDDSPRCGYDIDASDCDDKGYHQVVQKKDGSHHRQHRLTHVSAAALRHKYAILEHELRLQKSLSEECEDLGVDSPSASELFPEAELLFAASPAHDHTQDHGHHSHTPQPLLHHSSIPQPDLDDQIATDQLLPRSDMHDDRSDLGIGLEDVGIVTVSEDGMQATIALDQEEFARSHPNTTFHSEPTDEGEVQPFTISGLKGRHITSTIFHANRAPGTVLMTAPQTTVISQATAETSGVHNTVKYADIDNMINSLPGPHTHGNINLSSVLVKDDGLTRFDSILNDNRELHLSNTASHIVHATGNNTTQVIRRVCYGNKREQTSRFLIEESDNIMARHHAKMMEDSRDFGDVDDDGSSPERTELFWESNSASERDTRRPLDFSSDSDKCCKSPSFEENNSTDSSGIGAHMRLDSVIKDARGIERRGSADGSSADDNHAPPLRTYPPKRMYHALDAQRSLTGKTRAPDVPERLHAPDTHDVPERQDHVEGRRRASGRGVVKRGCHCCNGEPAPPRPKKPRQRKPNIDFTSN